MNIKSHETFLNDVKDHVLTINHEHGVFRSLTFAKPHSSDMHVNIVTSNGYLYYSGDMGAFTFKRLHDMFDFFRNKECEINPIYWHEKLEAHDRFGGSTEYSEELAKERINSYLEQFLDNLDMDDEDDQVKANKAKSAVADFLKDIGDEHSCSEAYDDWNVRDAGGMELNDFFDGGLDTHTSRFIWCLRAIVHVINLYDAGVTGERLNAVNYFKKQGYREIKKLVINSKEIGAKAYYDFVDHGFYGDSHRTRLKVQDLEWLLESWDFVALAGSLEDAKRLFELMQGVNVVEINGKEYLMSDFEKAIKDVELIQGVECV